MRSAGALLCAFLAGCPEAVGTGAATDAGLLSVGDAGNVFDAGPARGSVTILHLDMPPGFAAQMGESTLVEGPDGVLVLIDVGNNAHDDEVRDAVWARNAARTGRQPLEVEWVVATHFHGDHVGGLAGLLRDTGDPLVVTRGVVHRGWVDVGPGANEDDVGALCEVLRDGPLDRPLCHSPDVLPCDVTAASGTYAAGGCDGLLAGELDDPSDDAAHIPSYLDLGGGARLTFMAVDGFVSDGTQVHAPAGFGHEDTNEENARSIAAVITHGPFVYFFAGDLTGSGESTEPDVETRIAELALPRWLAGAGADVIHGGHHLRRTSSNPAFINALAPVDGKTRNVIGGISMAHLGSPHQEVLDRWADGARLASGSVWVTHRAPGGADHARLVDAQGTLVVTTQEGGARYTVSTESFVPVRAQ